MGVFTSQVGGSFSELRIKHGDPKIICHPTAVFQALHEDSGWPEIMIIIVSIVVRTNMTVVIAVPIVIIVMLAILEMLELFATFVILVLSA